MNFDYVQDLLGDYEAAEIDNRISPNDPMNNQWYFEFGKGAVGAGFDEPWPGMLLGSQPSSEEHNLLTRGI
jgi:hypothetical protein